ARFGQPPGVVALSLPGFGLGQPFVSSPLSTALTRTVSPATYGIALGVYNMLYFVGGSFGASLSTATLSARERASGAIFPFYRGDTAFAEFGDAYLVAVGAIAIALIVAW